MGGGHPFFVQRLLDAVCAALRGHSMMYGKPTRLPAFNKPAGPAPMMGQRLYMLKKVLAEKKMAEMGMRGKARGVPKLPVRKALG